MSKKSCECHQAETDQRLDSLERQIGALEDWQNQASMQISHLIEIVSSLNSQAVSQASLLEMQENLAKLQGDSDAASEAIHDALADAAQAAASETSSMTENFRKGGMHHEE